ncbi:hypothetical protein JTE90_021704 [Oedothorax gibbosus]|uniref:Uncharacterized protein n=1 Tax=Oedothorax gibbosus TaxID=931172 RepID=A0AAV6TR76_9ARAC|nr:hypothetical protein JTE90_021704 [Oedothorax gibbosus]
MRLKRLESIKRSLSDHASDSFSLDFLISTVLSTLLFRVRRNLTGVASYLPASMGSAFMSLPLLLVSTIGSREGVSSCQAVTLYKPSNFASIACPAASAVLVVYHRTHGHRIKRHNAVVSCVARGLEERHFTVHQEHRFSSSRGILKPDLLAIKDGKAFILDAQVISDGEPQGRAHRRKLDKYTELYSFCLCDA